MGLRVSKRNGIAMMEAIPTCWTPPSHSLKSWLLVALRPLTAGAHPFQGEAQSILRNLCVWTGKWTWVALHRLDSPSFYHLGSIHSVGQLISMSSLSAQETLCLVSFGGIQCLLVFIAFDPQGSDEGPWNHSFRLEQYVSCTIFHRLRRSDRTTHLANLVLVSKWWL